MLQACLDQRSVDRRGIFEDELRSGCEQRGRACRAMSARTSRAAALQATIDGSSPLNAKGRRRTRGSDHLCRRLVHHGGNRLLILPCLVAARAAP
jgi:hypothetical protein